MPRACAHSGKEASQPGLNLSEQQGVIAGFFWVRPHDCLHRVFRGDEEKAFCSEQYVSTDDRSKKRISCTYNLRGQ